MTPERRAEILEVWTIAKTIWKPSSHGNRFIYTDHEKMLMVEFSHDHLGRVYSEGLYISTFPKLRKIASQ